MSSLAFVYYAPLQDDLLLFFLNKRSSFFSKRRYFG